jgi:hypothetical protein
MRIRAQISKNSRLGSIATLNSHSNPTFCIARGLVGSCRKEN